MRRKSERCKESDRRRSPGEAVALRTGIVQKVREVAWKSKLRRGETILESGN